MMKYIGEFIGSLFFVFVSLSTHFHPAAMSIALFLALITTSGFINPMMVILQAANKVVPRESVIPLILAEIAGAFVAKELFRRVHL